ncbi:MAG: iron chelate uptake ABC transporter family permease subunit [Parvibaculales bacterium]
MTTPMLITAIALALLAGPLGCFVVWRRMAYFGDGLAHSALLGVAVGLVVGVSNQVGMIFVAILFAVMLIWLRSQHLLATDTLLGILAHAALSLGVVAMTLLGIEDAEVHDYLLGSLENVSPDMLVYVVLGCGLSLGLLMRLWPGLLLMTSSEELAHAEGVPIRTYEFLLMLLLGVAVAAAVQIVGILLITSLLIIPASTARLVSRRPETMAMTGSLFAALCMLGGPPFADAMALPLGPTIVTLTVALFLLVLMGRLAADRLKPLN